MKRRGADGIIKEETIKEIRDCPVPPTEKEKEYMKIYFSADTTLDMLPNGRQAGMNMTSDGYFLAFQSYIESEEGQ